MSPTYLRKITVEQVEGDISTDNSTIVPLGAGGVFTGVAESIKDVVDLKVSVFSDQASATDGLTIEQSVDGTNWDFDDKFTISASSGKQFTIPAFAGFFRVVYTNGGGIQTAFRLQVIKKTVGGATSGHRIEDSVVGEDDAVLVKAIISGKDETGVYQNARVDSSGVLLTSDILLAIAKGNVAGHSIYRKFGRISSIQSATPADCWEYGNTVGAEEYTFSTTAAIDSISSDNAGDTQTISITMLDIDYIEFTQTATLNGQARVPITPGFRLNRANNSNGTPTLGNVYIYENTPIVGGVPTLKSMVRGYISISGQQTLQGIYTVPAGVDAYLYELKTGMGGRKTGFATYEAFLRQEAGIFLIKDTHDLAATGSSVVSDIFTAARFFPAKTDFKPKVTVDTNGIGFSISFVIVLIEQ